VVLAGHSRGGLVISEAAEQAPEAIDSLAYICALMLPQGVSRSDFRDLQAPNPAFDAIVSPLPHGQGTIVDPAGAPGVFAQLSPPDLARAAAARLVAEPTGLRATPVMVSDDRWGRIPRTYIECLQDRTIPIADQRLMQEMSPGSRIVSLDCDHSPFLSDPDGLTRALLSCLLNTT
jgi:pimeloyl-ACP methyl ester carboxylesterase